MLVPVGFWGWFSALPGYLQLTGNTHSNVLGLAWLIAYTGQHYRFTVSNSQNTQNNTTFPLPIPILPHTHMHLPHWLLLYKLPPWCPGKPGWPLSAQLQPLAVCEPCENPLRMHQGRPSCIWGLWCLLLCRHLSTEKCLHASWKRLWIFCSLWHIFINHYLATTNERPKGEKCMQGGRRNL